MNEVAWSSSPNDEWNLIHLRPATLRLIYCDTEYWGSDALKPEGLKKRRQKHRKLTSLGIRPMPRRTEEYLGPEEERESVRQRRQKQAPKVGEAAIRFSLNEVDRQRLHQQLDELLDNYELEPALVDQLKIKKVTTWQMGYKDSEGEAQSHPLYGIQLDADPRKFEPDWPPITRIESVRLPKKESLKAPGEAKKAVILPDLQIPFHDEKALEVALKLIRDVEPDKVILLGDMLDLESFSRFDNIPLAKEYSKTTQDAIIQAHKLLATLRKMCPAAEIAVLEGNHDQRLTTNVLKNNKNAFGLKRADAPGGWPVLSVPFLCAFDTLDIEYISGYPANRYWINENLQVVHGNRVKSGGSTARVISDDERVSTIFGHVHRLETQYKTHHTFRGGKTNAAWGIGCLCKIDGSVPSRNRGVDLSGKPVENFENWQQAIAVVDYQDGDAPFHVSSVFINTFENYRAAYNGRFYESS